MSTHHRHFVPALSVAFLTSLYDSLIELTMQERASKQRLIEPGGLPPGQRILDLGAR